MSINLSYAGTEESRNYDSKILIVEDEVIIALYIQNVLHKNGYPDTNLVSSGQACLDELKKQRVDLILMDISLDGDMDGVETAEIINKSYDIPIIFLTAYSDNDILQKAKLINPYGYIIKPINAKELYAMVETSMYKHKMDNRLKESEQKFRTLFEQSKDAIILCDRKGLIQTINPSMILMLGYSIEEAEGMHIGEIFADREDLDEILSALFEKGFINDYEGRLRRKDDRAVDCSVTVTALRDEENEIKGYQGIIRDIAERKEMELKIMDSVDRERQRIGRDLHDGLGQILTGTGFLCELLIKKLAGQNIGEEANAREIYRLLNEAKEQTRNIARGLSPVNLGEGGFIVSVQQLCLNIEQLFNIRCSLDYDDDFTIKDENKGVNLYYIIMEALNNAVRHGNARNISVEIRMGEDRTILTVADDGSGLAGTRKSGGNGLGFHIMKYRAGLIGATLNIERGSSRGTLVSCVLKNA